MSAFKPYTTILKAAVIKYADAVNKDDKKNVVEETVAAIRAAHQESETTQFLPAAMHKKVEGWFKNNQPSKRTPAMQARTGGSPRPSGKNKWGKKYTFRQGVMTLYREVINDMISEKTASKESGERLQFHPVVVTELINGMTQEQKDDVTATVEKWNQEGAPEKEQIKNAKGLGKKATKFMDEMKASAGVQMFILAAYQGPDGIPHLTSFESEPRRQGKSFMEKEGADGKWKEDTYGAFKDYVARQFRDLGDEQLQKDFPDTDREDGDFDEDEDGWAVLPPRARLDLHRSKQMIRDYVTFNYKRVTHNPNAKVPWVNLAERGSNLFDKACLPGTVSGLRDPSHLRADEVTSLWDHWTSRQKNGEVGFKFVACLEKDKRVERQRGKKGKGKGKEKEKRKMKYVEIDEEDEDEDEDEDEEEDAEDKDEDDDMEEDEDDEVDENGAQSSTRKGKGSGSGKGRGRSTQASTSTSANEESFVKELMDLEGGDEEDQGEDQEEAHEEVRSEGGEEEEEGIVRVMQMCNITSTMLKALSADNRYHELVDTLHKNSRGKQQLKTTLKLPGWVTPSAVKREDYLPKSFHTVKGFKATKALLHQQPVTVGDWFAIVLGIGLAIREVYRVQFIEPDNIPDGMPTHVSESPLCLDQVEDLLDRPPITVPRPSSTSTTLSKRDSQSAHQEEGEPKEGPPPNKKPKRAPPAKVVNPTPTRRSTRVKKGNK